MSRKTKRQSSPSVLSQKLNDWSKRRHIPGFKTVTVHDVCAHFRGQFVADELWGRASSISYNMSMAWPPTMIFLFTLIPLLPISEAFLDQLYSLIRDIVPGPRNYKAIIDFLDDFLRNPRNGLLSVGFLLSLFFSSNAMMGIMRSFDRNYPGFKKRKGIRKRLVAIRITLILFVLFFACLALLIAQDVVLKWIGIENETVRSLIRHVRWIFIFLLFFTIIAYIYRAAPSVHKKWHIISPGSVVATMLMLLCALGFSWWVSHFGSFNKLYGSIGTILIIMVMIYLCSLSLLIGFEINASIYALAHKNISGNVQRES
ncbi:MAG: YihY/virulence factor BrkB family protein [Niabella sp.]